LVERILKLFTYKNDIVYDPFSGAGTTCAVCGRLGKRYIGTDINEQYCKTAIERIEYEKCLKENPLWE
jgi:site-specific DNA-methyltransferase (adenine-specific)